MIHMHIIYFTIDGGRYGPNLGASMSNCCYYRKMKGKNNYQHGPRLDFMAAT